MKKLVCLIIVILLAALTAFCAFAADDDTDYLTITDEGRVLARVKVGSEFLYSVGLCASNGKIQNGSGELHYDSAYAEPVAYGPVTSSGEVNREAYCFPKSIRGASLVANFELDNVLKYNFAKMNGIEEFDDVDKHYFKMRFKAVAPGTVEIRHRFYTLYSYDNGQTVRLYYLYKANQKLDRVPYTLSKVELPLGLLGDADGDNELTVVDATLIQKLTAGGDIEYDSYRADVNADGDINLRDALEILRAKAGMELDSMVGEWIYSSEQ